MRRERVRGFTGCMSHRVNWSLHPAAAAAHRPTRTLRGLEPDRATTLRYRLRATMPAELTVPPARAYEYYDPGRRGESPPVRLTVLPGE